MDPPDTDDHPDGPGRPEGAGRSDSSSDDRLGGLPVSSVLGSVTSTPGPCEACGSPQARRWSTPEGPARLCPPCATLHGIGCP